MSRPLDVEITDLAKTQIRTAEDWWHLNRPKAPNAIREEVERAASIISAQPHVGTPAACVIVAGPRTHVRLAPVVIVLAVIGGATTVTARRGAVPLVVARIVVARIEIHTVLPSCLWMPNSCWLKRSACLMKSERRWQAS